MPSGSCEKLSELPEGLRSILEHGRRAVLATIDSKGRPHVVPVAFALRSGDIVTAVDQKPKTGATLARIRNISDNPAVSLLFDRWEEDWTKLGWVMVRGEARIEPPGGATEQLSARYPQYHSDPPRGQVIVIHPIRITWWSSE